MLGWKDVMMKQEQYKDLLREAEHRALVQQVVMDRSAALSYKRCWRQDL